MPNWCYTSYAFYGNKRDIKTLHDKVIEWTSQPFIETDFGRDWLGNILIGSGLGDYIDGDNNEGVSIRCRGELLDVGEVDDSIPDNEPTYWFLQTETAWAPMAMMWQKVVEKLGLDIQFAYQAEEPGCELYEIYDPHGLGSFDEENVYVDAYLQDEDYEKYPILNDIEDYRYWGDKEFQSWLDSHGFNNSDEFIASLDFDNEDSYVSVYRFIYTNDLY